MSIHVTLQEGEALYGLLAETTTDIVIRTDDEGFILHASPALEKLGISTSDMLISPHLYDLVHPSWLAAVRSEYETAINGRKSSEWLEFKASTRENAEHWYAMKLRHIGELHGKSGGALVILRAIDDRKFLEASVFAASFTDPLTGLTNRQAFNFMLRHLVKKDASGCLALFDIDHFKAMNRKFGFEGGDDLLVGFSRFLQNALRPQDIISRVDSDRFGALLPDITPDQAKRLTRTVVDAFADLGKVSKTPGIRLTVSCGVARIEESFDATMAKAGEALHLAKAIGGSAAKAA